MAIGKLSADLTADVAITGASLNGLAYAAYAWGPEITNTALYPYARISLALSSGISVGTGSYISFFLVEPDENGNYAASSGNPGVGSWVLNFVPPGATFQYTGSLTVPRLLVPKYKWVVWNLIASSAFPATSTAVCTSRRFADEIL